MTLNSVKILLTFFLLWLTTQFSLAVENFLAYFLILSVGILHGSNDLKLIQKITNTNQQNIRKILFAYASTTLVTLIIFIFFPKLALVFFVLFSSYHFGEQHLSEDIAKRTWSSFLLYTLYGAMIFFMIFYVHTSDVLQIIFDITSIRLYEDFFKYGLLFSVLATFLLSFVLIYNKYLKSNILQEVLYLILFYIIFKNSTLLWSFAIYFIIWHSIPSLKDQILMLYGEISKVSMLKYLKSSFIYWIISVLGICGLLLYTIDNENLFNLLFFAILASVTFPHVIVIGRMHK
jgi:beta-carotene 15,15'-dioxygenase